MGPMSAIAPRTHSWAVLAIQVAFVAAILAMWQFSVSLGWIDSLFLAAPLATARALIPTTILAEPHLAATFSAFAVALVTGVLAALVVGLLVNTSRYTYTVFMPLLVLGVIIPKVTLLPLFVLWFGIEKATIVVYGALSAFFPMVVNVSAAGQEVKPAQITLARVMGYSKIQTYRKVIIPAMTYGPRSTTHQFQRALSIDSLYQAACVYARIAVEVCGEEKPRGRTR